MLLLAGGLGALYVRGRSKAAAPQDAGLTEEEADRLRDILKK